MAVLPKSVEVGTEWTEISAPLGMTDGKSHAVEVQDKAKTGEGWVTMVDTDDNVAPGDDVAGHEWYPRTAGQPATYRAYPKVAGRYIWARSSGPAFVVVATEI